MRMRRTLSFDVWGERGLFKKSYMNNVFFSFPIITPTAIMGMVGAILGLDYNTITNSVEHNRYIDLLNELDMKVSIVNRNKIQYINNTKSLIQTKDYANHKLTVKVKSNNLEICKGKELEERTLVQHSYVYQPKYTIFINFKNETIKYDDKEYNIIEELKKRIIMKNFVYDVYLGKAVCNANIEFNGVFNFDLIAGDKNEVEILSVVNGSNILQCNVQNRAFIQEGNFPIAIDNRRVFRCDKILIETNQNTIKGVIKEYWTGIYNNQKINLVFL